MSRQKVEEAIRLASNNHVDQAELLLKNLDKGFVEKRLRHHLQSIAFERAGAEVLWHRLFEAKEEPIALVVPVIEVESEDLGAQVVSDIRTELPVVDLADRLLIETPGPFLRAVSAMPPVEFNLDGVDVAQVFSLVGLASLARMPSAGNAQYVVKKSGVSSASRFAHALGFEEVLNDRPQHSSGEVGRTVKLRRITRFEQIESSAREISQLILPQEEEGRRTIYYVLVELLRNVVQHSRDPLGGVVAAQRMDSQNQYARPVIQVAVGDAGLGILAAMRGLHPELQDPGEALEKALRPHISGTFEEGLTGSQQNAGMGLFFISEMAKLTAGRLLVASRGDALLLEGDREGNEHHKIRLLGTPGFPGTLVAFELPMDEVKDFSALIETIGDRARKRTPQRAVHRWLKYEEPDGVLRMLVRLTSEDTAAAQRFAAEELEPRVLKKVSFILDFRGTDVATQSYLHALLFEVLRLAWAKRVPIYIANAQPAVKSGLELLESYALGG